MTVGDLIYEILDEDLVNGDTHVFLPDGSRIKRVQAALGPDGEGWVLYLLPCKNDEDVRLD